MCWMVQYLWRRWWLFPAGALGTFLKLPGMDRCFCGRQTGNWFGRLPKQTRGEKARPKKTLSISPITVVAVFSRSWSPNRLNCWAMKHFVVESMEGFKAIPGIHHRCKENQWPGVYKWFYCSTRRKTLRRGASSATPLMGWFRLSPGEDHTVQLEHPC